MKTRICYICDSYAQCIDNLDFETSAEEYARCGEWNEKDLHATITAEVYNDEADPMFDSPVKKTEFEIDTSCTFIDENGNIIEITD